MKPDLARKFKILGFIFLLTCAAGVLFQLIKESHVDYNSVLIGGPLGLVFGLMELFLLPRAEGRLRQWSFTTILVFKAVLSTAIIYAVTAVLAIVAGMIEGRSIRELPGVLLDVDRLILVVYTLVVYSLLVFLIQVNHLLGEGVLWKFIRGKYHKPREEARIFMFLDMKSSTTIAEQLGHVRFYTLLNELFHEISQPVLQTKAEIYQYVGDEVVLTWKVADGLQRANCLEMFFMFRNALVRKRETYYRNFGVRPEFKAGLHFGKVVSAQIGDLKREIVYNGDVLNTAARIQSECNTYQRDCLVSGVLMNRLKSTHGFVWEKVDTVTLRGKEREVELYSVTDVRKGRVALAGEGEKNRRGASL